MASDSAAKPVNGEYSNRQQYGAAEQHQSSQGAANTASAGAYGGENGNPADITNNSSSAASESSGGVPKDEVGWYFVEQYYTTLSKSPEKLHLFYSKRSQFVSGVEAEKVSVSVGQRAINERIKELDIQDCKVRVSNVDSQESFKNIVVQVIGEMSNKAAPHRKFVQTFVLAEQPNGYFVLNDIFRYINEDEEEEVGNEGTPEPEPAATSAPEPEPATLTSSNDPTQQQRDIEQVDKKLEEQIRETPSVNENMEPEPADLNDSTAQEPAEVDHSEDAPAAAVSVEEEKPEMPEEPADATANLAELQPEKPKDPDPTPVASPPKPTATPAQAQTPAVPQKPAAPKTWANLVASNRIAAPIVPSPAASTSPVPSQPKATPSSANRSTTPPISASDDAAGRPQQNGNSGWQTAGTDSSKRQSRQQSMSGSPEKDNVLGYVKNVTEKVDASLLKGTLLEYGKLVYFDVSRQKNCAFVEFADPAGYNAAVAANPHSIGGEQIYVEERRPRPTAYGGGFGGRGGMRGGRGSNDGRPGSQGRGNYPKDGGRGGFMPRGRGSGMTPRGRGQPQAA